MSGAFQVPGSIPFVPGQYDYRPGDRISDLIMRSGEIQAQNAQRQGDIWGSTIANVGQQIGGAIQQHQQQQAMSKHAQAVQALFSGEQMPSAQEIIRHLGLKDGLDVIKGLNAIHPEAKPNYKDRMEAWRDTARGVKALPKELQEGAYQRGRAGLIANGMATPTEIPEAYDPSLVDQVAAYGEAQAKPPVPSKHVVTTVGPDGKPIQKLANEEELSAGIPSYVAPKEPKDVNKFWVVRDGKPLRVSEAEYRPGDLPASTREQGRPVTSGDASKIADFDTSLDDLNKLTAAVTGSKATGTAARVGAALPNFVTEATGWGADAKSKQATIDRVKQVIGKALEGGVLRKEDEYKYEKILPTIGDVPTVVKAKLDGLWAAIQQRRQTQLDSLADAGYDITKYSARAPRERQGGTIGRFKVEVVP